MGLILTQAVSKCRLATKAGEAMFFDEDIDFSAYAGGTKLIAFKDSGNRFAYAYGGAVGGGEALSGEKLPAIDFTNAALWSLVTCTPADADTATHTTTTAAIVSPLGYTPVVGRLYKGQSSLTVSAGFCQGLAGNGSVPIFSGYRTAANTSLRYLWFGLIDSDGATFNLASNTFKELSNVPATGLLLVSAYGGATRNMLSTEAGFLPNSITTVYVYNVVAPSTPSPTDGATVAYTTSQALQVTNADSGACDIKFYTGAGVQIGATQSGVAAGATATVTATGLSAGLQSFYATATNSVGTIQSATWSYTINTPPVISSMDPPDGSTATTENNTVPVDLTVTATDADSHLMTISIYIVGDGMVWQWINVPSGTPETYFATGYDYDVEYEWYVIADDGYDQTESAHYKITIIRAGWTGGKMLGVNYDHIGKLLGVPRANIGKIIGV